MVHRLQKASDNRLALIQESICSTKEHVYLFTQNLVLALFRRKKNIWKPPEQLLHLIHTAYTPWD